MPLSSLRLIRSDVLAHLPRRGSSALVLLFGVCLGAVSACESPADRLSAIYQTAPTGKAAVAGAIVTAWRANAITLDDTLNLAHDRLEKVGDGASVTFAGAVLDAVATLEADLTKRDINELLWYRVGTLAGTSAAVAMRLGDEKGAGWLATAGPQRWQTDMYWIRNPGHDALVSFIMARSGHKGEALNRLRDRVEQSDEIRQAYEAIQKMP